MESQSITKFAGLFAQKTQMMATLLLTLAIVGLAVLLLGVKIFFVKGGRFPNTHIHDNAEMRKRGITCARDKEFYNYHYYNRKSQKKQRLK